MSNTIRDTMERAYKASIETMERLATVYRTTQVEVETARREYESATLATAAHRQWLADHKAIGALPEISTPSEMAALEPVSPIITSASDPRLAQMHKPDGGRFGTILAEKIAHATVYDAQQNKPTFEANLVSSNPSDPISLHADRFYVDGRLIDSGPVRTMVRIPPVIGRKLWLYFEPMDRRNEFKHVAIRDYNKPLDASIAFVSENADGFDYCTVSFIDHEGDFHNGTFPLRQPADEKPNAREWLEWMPFQKGQASAQS